MRPLVECIPNFSEGRRSDVVEAIADTIRSIPGVTLLDHSLDADHNRSVLTFGHLQVRGVTADTIDNDQAGGIPLPYSTLVDPLGINAETAAAMISPDGEDATGGIAAQDR